MQEMTRKLRLVDSAIWFPSALKEQERRARTQGQPIWMKLGNPVPGSPETQRDRPAYAVRIPKQAVKPGKQAELAAKKQLVLPPKNHFESSASGSDSDSDIYSGPEKSDKSDQSHRCTCSKAAAAEAEAEEACLWRRQEDEGAEDQGCQEAEEA